MQRFSTGKIQSRLQTCKLIHTKLLKEEHMPNATKSRIIRQLNLVTSTKWIQQQKIYADYAVTANHLLSECNSVVRLENP